MDKKKIFERELNYINNSKIRTSATTMVELLPDYFFSIEASSTGKYHPEYALGEGGLLRHTKAAVRIAYELLSDPVIGDKYSSDEKDLMVMGLILHDGLKLGLKQDKYTKFDHPLVMVKYIEDNKDKLELTDKERELVESVIKTHMGPWTKDYDGNEVLEAPKTKYQSFVHMCDFLASRKVILVPFDKDNNIIG
jgi:23S rRNA maturation-related 3'-5' exoribonuclease YhaM